MSIKRIITFLMVAVLLCGCFAALPGQAEGVYQLGDKMDDFTVTLSDGTSVSLYGLLAEKKMVFINFWATWCGPCRIEFPYMQQAYDEMSDDVGIVALSINHLDTDEVILDYKDEVGLTTLPLGQAGELANRFYIPAYPTSVVVDRYGVVCLQHAGAIVSKKLFTNLFSIYTGDDYLQSVILNDMPEPEIVEAANSDALAKAINAPGSDIVCSSLTNGDKEMPFVPSEDGSYASSDVAGNQVASSNVTLSFSANAGDVFSYEYKIEGRDYMEKLVAYLDGEFADFHSGETDWSPAGIPIETDGEHELKFIFMRGIDAGYIPSGHIRNAKLLTGSDAANYQFPAPPAPGTLEGSQLKAEVLSDNITPIYDVLADGTADGEAMYIVNGDSVDVRLLVGEEIDARLAATVITKGQDTPQYSMLGRYDTDAEGYLASIDMTDVPANLALTLVDNALKPENVVEYQLFSSEEGVRNFLRLLLPQMEARYPEEVFASALKESVAYEDGTLLCTFAEIYAELKGESEPESLPKEVEFVVKYTDADGNPVAGVLTQICDDAVCMVFPSDENGVVRHVSAPQPYEVHVLMVPEGYAPIADIYHMDAMGGELDITLNKAG